jgi:hypothetical protein
MAAAQVLHLAAHIRSGMTLQVHTLDSNYMQHHNVFIRSWGFQNGPRLGREISRLGIQVEKPMDRLAILS